MRCKLNIFLCFISFLLFFSYFSKCDDIECFHGKIENSTCICDNSATSGFWSGDKCNLCLNTNFDINSNCTKCINSNFDSNSKCTKCLNDKLDLNSKCTKCLKPNSDISKKCLSCYNDEINGFYEGDNCDKCSKSGLDLNKGCKVCLNGTRFDINSNCKNCYSDAIHGFFIGENCEKCKYTGLDPEQCKTCQKDKYFGEKCEIPFCFGFKGNDTNNVCSGRGKCKQFNQCVCNYGYNGQFCETFSLDNLSYFIISLLVFGTIVIIGSFCLYTIITRKISQSRERKKTGSNGLIDSPHFTLTGDQDFQDEDDQNENQEIDLTTIDDELLIQEAQIAARKIEESGETDLNNTWVDIGLVGEEIEDD